MIVRIDKSFQKDANNINDAKIKLAIGKMINDIQKANTLSSIKILKN